MSIAYDDLARMVSSAFGNAPNDTWGNRVTDSSVLNAHGERGSYSASYIDGVTQAATSLLTIDSSQRDDLGRIATLAADATYDAQDRLLTYGNLSFTYTDNGELETRTRTVSGQNELTSYTYDVFGNLRSVTLPAGISIRYRAADFMIRNGVPYRILTVHLGSVRLGVNASTGAIVQRMDYDVFGKVTQDWVAAGQSWRVPFGFAGGLYDPDTKLVRFGARDYDAEVGRWTAKDPIRFRGGDANLYGYVLADPVNFLDANGLYPLGGFPEENRYNPAPPVALSNGIGGNLGAGVVSPVLEGSLGYIFDVSRSGWFRSFAIGPGVMPGISAGFGLQVCLSWVPGAMWGDGASIGANTPVCGVDIIASPLLKPHGFCGSVGLPGASGGWDGHVLWTDTQPPGE